MILTPTKILIVIVVIAIFFGYKKLPEVGKGLGEALRNFRKGITEPEEIEVKPETKKVDANEGQAREDSKEAARSGRFPNRAAAGRKR